MRKCCSGNRLIFSKGLVEGGGGVYTSPGRPMVGSTGSVDLYCGEGVVRMGC